MTTGSRHSSHRTASRWANLRAGWAVAPEAGPGTRPGGYRSRHAPEPGCRALAAASAYLRRASSQPDSADHDGGWTGRLAGVLAGVVVVGDDVGGGRGAGEPPRPG